jgi:hypothetical protein
MQILLFVSTAIFWLIVALVAEKSNAERLPEKEPLETWAIIDREYVEFTPEEIEWRRAQR